MTIIADEVRQVVREAFCAVEQLAGHPDTNAIADRVAAQLAGRTLTLNTEDRIALEFLRNDSLYHGRYGVVAVLDRLLARPKAKP